MCFGMVTTHYGAKNHESDSRETTMTAENNERHYRAPNLVELGQIADLTAGGSALGMETGNFPQGTMN